MISYESLDLLQLQLYSATSLDYDIDVRIAQYANIFGKGFSEDNHPIEMILAGTYGLGSSDSPGSSRSPSIGQDDVRTESSAAETLSPPSIQDHERIRSFDESHTISHLIPSTCTTTHQSAISLGTLSTSDYGVLKPELPTSRKRTRKCRTSRKDQDAGSESDQDTDDDYVPNSRSSGPKRRCLVSHLPAHHSSPRNKSSSSNARKRLSRNKRANSVVAIDPCNSIDLNLVCPECGWKQVNKRLPDFKRHLRTHTRPDEDDQSQGWWCKGVLLEDVHKFNIPKGAESFKFLGQERIGGCRRTFSRRDALKRHLDNVNGTCVGWPYRAK